MHLDFPVKRVLLHTRQVICSGFAREDGLWDVEADLVDIRSVDCLNNRNEVLVKAGEILHGMHLQITVDATMRILDAQGITEHSPHGECRAVANGYSVLKGLTIGPGFLSTVKELFRGINGCTHLTALVGPAATTAIQTIIADREQRERTTSQADPQKIHEKSLVNSCYAWRDGGEAFNAHGTTISDKNDHKKN